MQKGPRPLLATVRLVSLGLFGAALAFSDVFDAGSSPTESLAYRFLIGGCSLIILTAAWKIWMRRTNSWLWFILAGVICVLGWLVLRRMKMEEDSGTRSQMPVSEVSPGVPGLGQPEPGVEGAVRGPP